MPITVDTYKFVASHVKQLRGYGHWWFQIGSGQHQREVAFTGSYTDAKKKALKAAKKYGYSRIYVLP